MVPRTLDANILVGVGAVFYVQVALPYFIEDENFLSLARHLKPVIFAMALSSTAIHGLTVPLVQAWSRLTPSDTNFAQGTSRGIAKGYDNFKMTLFGARTTGPINRSKLSFATTADTSSQAPVNNV